MQWEAVRWLLGDRQRQRDREGGEGRGKGVRVDTQLLESVWGEEGVESRSLRLLNRI